MEITLNNNFSLLDDNLLYLTNAGGWTQAASAFAGCIIIGAAPLVSIGAGIGASVVGTPLVGVGAGIATFGGMTSAGAACLDYAAN